MSEDKKRILKKSLVQLLVIITFVILSKIALEVLNLSLFENFKIPSDVEVFDSFGKGAIVLFMALVFLYLLTNNYFLSVIIFYFLIIAIAFSNNEKVFVRNEYITYSDLGAIFAVDTLLPAVANAFVPIVIGIVIFIVLSGIAIFGLRKIDKNRLFRLNKWTRLLLTGVLLVPTVLFFKNVEQINKDFFGYQLNEEGKKNVNPIVLARKNGFVTSYLQTISPTYMDEPDIYSKDIIQEITQKYKPYKGTSKTQNINDEKTIVVLSESFITTTNFPDLLLPDSELPTPYIDNLIQTSGGMIQPKNIGGGTANTEFAILSGFTLSLLNSDLAVPFTDFYESSPNHLAINHFGEKSIGIHSHTSTLYNRKKIYNTIGFDDYRFVDEGIKYTDKIEDGKYISDKSFFEEIEDVLPEYDFIHGISMQNHYPYTSVYPETDLDLKLNETLYEGKEAFRKEKAINFFRGIHHTDAVVEEFINKIEEMDENVNVIFYGDHLPGAVIPNVEQYQDRIFETPFFIYRNHDRKIEPLAQNITPAFLFGHFLNAGDYEKSGFYVLMGKLLDAGIGDVFDDTVTINNQTVSIDSLSKENKELVKDYQLIQYDSLFGKNYAGEAFFE